MSDEQILEFRRTRRPVLVLFLSLLLQGCWHSDLDEMRNGSKGRLYFLTGHPTDGMPLILTSTTLFALGSDGDLEVVDELWSAEEGVSYIRAYPEVNRIVMRDGWPWNGNEEAQYKVIRTGARAGLAAELEWEDASIGDWEYFVQTSPPGPFILSYHGGDDPRLSGLGLSSGFVQPEWEVFPLVTVQGVQAPGLPGLDYLDLFVAEDNTLEFRKGERRIRTEWRPPPGSEWAVRARVAMFVNNRRFQVLSAVSDRVEAGNGDHGVTRFYVLDKDRNEWSSFAATGNHSVYTEIATQQADCEVLLVNNDEVYYRSFDAVFRAEIVNGTVLEPSLVFQGDVVPDIHWAFAGTEWQGSESQP